MNIFCLALFFLVLSIAYPCSSFALTIAKNGKAQCVIVRPADATKHEKAACSDLQTYLNKISGASPKILSEGMQFHGIPIYIGPCKAAKHVEHIDRVKGLKDDGYIIEIKTDSMYLVGKDPLATRFAVFGLLEDHLGIRWYMPGDIGEFIPHLENIILNESVEIREPSFPMRWIGTGDWAVRNRMNVGVDNLLGIHVYGPGHTFFKLVPADNYFDKHPEYFAMLDGKRKRYDESPTHRNQLETANPDLIRVISDNALRVLEQNPELDVMTIFPNDGLGFSESPESKALDGDYPITVEDVNKKFGSLGPEQYGALSRRMTIFYTEVARRILSSRPEKYVMVGAYKAYLTPPQDLNIRPPEHTVVQVTHNDCHDLPIESGSCNALYRHAIDGWKRVFPSFAIYEYYWKLAANELPYPILHSIRKDIPYFHSNGCFGMYTQYSPRNVGTLGLNYYVAAKLLWNVNADVDKILDGFFHNFYGKSWQPMKRYHETLEKAVIDSNVHLPAHYVDLLSIFNDKRSSINLPNSTTRLSSSADG